MPAHRLDPEHERAVMLGVKLGRTDAERLTELARRAGIGKSAFVRAALRRELDRAEPEPPIPGGVTSAVPA